MVGAVRTTKPATQNRLPAPSGHHHCPRESTFCARSSPGQGLPHLLSQRLHQMRQRTADMKLRGRKRGKGPTVLQEGQVCAIILEQRQLLVVLDAGTQGGQGQQQPLSSRPPTNACISRRPTIAHVSFYAARSIACRLAACAQCCERHKLCPGGCIWQWGCHPPILSRSAVFPRDGEDDGRAACRRR